MGLRKGCRVRFRLGDVYYPGAEEIRCGMSEHVELAGRILFLSDSGSARGVYAVLEVAGLATPAIVRVDRLMQPDGTTQSAEDAAALTVAETAGENQL